MKHTRVKVNADVLYVGFYSLSMHKVFPNTAETETKLLVHVLLFFLILLELSILTN